MAAPKKVTLLVANLSGGGAERVMVNVANAFALRSHSVELILARNEGRYQSQVSSRVVLRSFERRLSACLLPLVSYLRENRPELLIVAGENACALAVMARALARSECRVVLSIHCPLRSRGEGIFLRDWLNLLVLKTALPFGDRIVTVSDGLRQEALRQIQATPEKFLTIYNPLFSAEIEQIAAAPVSQHWLQHNERSFKVIVAAGRLVRLKGFDVLLEALASIRMQEDVRLILLGEGPEEQRLKELARRHAIDNAVDFAGFVANPYSYMQKSDAVIMSSRLEGFGNVLVEAMAVGTPVVSTDCPHGPREILANGQYGPLVPVDDAESLATGILVALAHPVAPEKLKSRAAFFSIERSADAYEALLNLPRISGKASATSI